MTFHRADSNEKSEAVVVDVSEMFPRHTKDWTHLT